MRSHAFMPRPQAEFYDIYLIESEEGGTRSMYVNMVGCEFPRGVTGKGAGTMEGGFGWE